MILKRFFIIWETVLDKAYLDQKCAEIDKTIKEKNEQLDVLKQYKKSLIYEYVTGKKEVSNSNGERL